MSDTNTKPVVEEEFLKYDLERNIYSLLNQEPFFAALSRHVIKTPNRSIPTAGVRITEDGDFELAYNPDYFANIEKQDHVRGVLMHEFLHITLDHLTSRFISSDPDDKTKVDPIFNISGDLAINSHIRREWLPQNICMPGEGDFAKLPVNKTLEWYWGTINNDKKLKEKLEKQYGSGQQQTLDDHSGWGGPNAANEKSKIAKEVAKAKMREMLEKATNECTKSNSWGSVGQDMQADIRRFLAGSIDWRAVLRMFIRTSIRAEKHNSWKRLNKKMPYVFPGRKVKRQARIAIAVDQSGSVDDHLLSLLFSEFESLAKFATFTIIPFDTNVAEDKIWTWKKDTHHKTERVLCGGTDFNAPTEYVNKHGNFDALLIATDMCAPKPVKCKIQRAWITNEVNAKAPYFKPDERVIIATDRKG